MELIITDMVKNKHGMGDLSGSVAELGKDAAKITWNNCLDYAERYPFLSTKEQIEEAKEYFKGFGAWDAEDIKGWTDKEVQALVIQYIAGEIREMEGMSYREYLKAAEAGRVSGLIYKCGKEWCCYLGG